MEMDNIVLDLLKSMDGKIDRITQDIAVVKIKDAEQAQRLDSMEEKLGFITARNKDIDERLKKIEAEFTPKKEIDVLYDKVRHLEEIPKTKIITKVDFMKKALLAGLAVIITGTVVSLGAIIWKILTHINDIIVIIENL